MGEAAEICPYDRDSCPSIRQGVLPSKRLQTEYGFGIINRFLSKYRNHRLMSVEGCGRAWLSYIWDVFQAGGIEIWRIQSHGKIGE